MPCECEIIRSENNEVSDKSNLSYDQLWAASLTGDWTPPKFQGKIRHKKTQWRSLSAPPDTLAAIGGRGA